MAPGAGHGTAGDPCIGARFFQGRSVWMIDRGRHSTHSKQVFHVEDCGQSALRRTFSGPSALFQVALRLMIRRNTNEQLAQSAESE